jgi:hypothetical protein
VIVAVDPGKTTGFATYDPAARRLGIVTSASFLDAAAMLRDLRTLPGVALLVVEDSRGLPIYAKRDHVRGRARDRVARNVGRIDRDVELWLALAERLRIPVRAAEPVRAKKWSAADLEAVTGYDARSNQHGRDAARLAWQYRHLTTATPQASSPRTNQPKRPLPKHHG